jgi:hypothetical protein
MFCIIFQMFFPYFFLSLADETNILSLPHVVPLAFDNFASQLVWSFNFTNVLAWALFGLNLPSQLVFITMPMALRSQTSFLIIVLSFFLIAKNFG